MTATRLGRRRRRLVALLGVMVLAGAGCATQKEKEQAQEQDAVTRPEWRVGDRWVFQHTTLAGAATIVTHQVVSATLEGYTIRVLGHAGETTRQWTPELHLVRETLSGGATARYDPPASYYAWPLTLAKSWSQEFQYTDGRNDGRYVNTWKVAGTLERIDTMAGRYYALPIERRSGAQRLETYWYSPRVRYWVRLEDYLRGYVEELVEFRPWGVSTP
jgi:hypothetical protein